MESFSYLFILIVLTVSVSQTYSEETINHNGDYHHPALYFNEKDSGWNKEHALRRHKRQNDKQENGNSANEPKPPPENPLEHLILNHDKGLESGASLARVKRQYRRYPYPYPVPILVGRGFGGPGFGRRGFGGRGFGGRGGGFAGRGGGFGGRGGGFGGGFGGGRGGGRG